MGANRLWAKARAMATAPSSSTFEIRDRAAGPTIHVVVASGEIDLHAAPQASELARVRGFAAAAARRFGLDPRQRYDFTVAANEAAANAIQHGRPCSDETIHVWVTDGNGRLTLGVRDAGIFELD